MRLVLLSGGSGKRLWPLSNDSRSKQFLKLLESETAKEESMIQRVWKQIKRVELDDKTIIATNKSQYDMILNQLNEKVEIVIEPERRDTFPAIALSATYLFSVQNVDLDEIVCVLPVDPYVDDTFFLKIKETQDVLEKTNADMALIGVHPTFPAESYGYIVPAQNNSESGFVKVSHFKEKPKKQEAEILIANSALWNCGVFAFKLRYLINFMERNNLPTNYKELLHVYNELPKISFDYMVVEKTERIVAIPYCGSWKDLGTWDSLTGEMATNILGKGLISEDSKDSHIINELGIPIAIVGLSSIVVAASPDGILISDKSKSPHIKDLVNNFENRPMYEERRWGWYRVLDYTKDDSCTEILTRRICVNEGKNLSYQFHSKRSEIWNIISGTGEVVINGRLSKINSGDIIKIESETNHALKAITELEFIEIQRGTQLIEEDVMRICNDWDEILSKHLNNPF
ncbi:mannose-1-phosphate guanylyltransferase [Paenibacillus sp. LMG 31461]|uniref:Mannose-1-phosphate guanylyltransferase n=1 Tax=Paenibacillus plantarum TaxID=2654975 RepID=A0ABX1XCM6_9BACL|nr:sugar phosphate nucleotidyltransferase [Paenibacillus plantarum]NOU66235.1 mannose-1-phosphate guanylyltransferase [Paenibacillus plantarum]